MTTSATAVDEGRLQEFVGRFAGDLGAAIHGTTVLIGDKLGLYAAMSDGEPVIPAARAELDWWTPKVAAALENWSPV